MYPGDGKAALENLRESGKKSPFRSVMYLSREGNFADTSEISAADQSVSVRRAYAALPLCAVQLSTFSTNMTSFSKCKLQAL